MTNKEKVIEVIIQTPLYTDENGKIGSFKINTAQIIANALSDSGLIQEDWISVKGALPPQRDNDRYYTKKVRIKFHILKVDLNLTLYLLLRIGKNYQPNPDKV